MTEAQTPEARLAAAGWELPAPPIPNGRYRPAAVWGNLAVTAGQVPKRSGTLVWVGRVGAEVAEADARTAAEMATLNALAALADELSGLSAIVRVLQLRGYVNAETGYTRHSHVLDAASTLLDTAFPDAGGHARTAVGVAGLPGNAPVEVELMAALNS